MTFAFSNFHDFLAMGGYADYVWSAYLFIFLVVGVNIIKPLWRHKKELKGLLKSKFR